MEHVVKQHFCFKVMLLVSFIFLMSYAKANDRINMLRAGKSELLGRTIKAADEDALVNLRVEEDRSFPEAAGPRLDLLAREIELQHNLSEVHDDRRSLQRNRAGTYDKSEFFPCGNETAAGSQLFCISKSQSCTKDTNGMPACECFEGLTGETCGEQVNECLRDTYPCPTENSNCVMLSYPQRYKCSCMPGFIPRLPVVWDNPYVPAEYRPEECLPLDIASFLVSDKSKQSSAPSTSTISEAPTSPPSSVKSPTSTHPPSVKPETSSSPLSIIPAVSTSPSSVTPVISTSPSSVIPAASTSPLSVTPSASNSPSSITLTASTIHSSVTPTASSSPTSITHTTSFSPSSATPISIASCIITPDCDGKLNDHYHCNSDGKCACKDGYDRISNKCIDRNECEKDEWNICHRFADCNNLLGSYSCQCREGYEDAFANAPPGTVCQELNECENGTHDCEADSICVDRSPPLLWECIAQTNSTSQTLSPPNTNITSSTITTTDSTPSFTTTQSTTTSTSITTSSSTTTPASIATFTSTTTSTSSTSSVTSTPPAISTTTPEPPTMTTIASTTADSSTTTFLRAATTMASTSLSNSTVNSTTANPPPVITATSKTMIQLPSLRNRVLFFLPLVFVLLLLLLLTS